MPVHFNKIEPKLPEHYYFHTKEWAHQSGLDMESVYTPIPVASNLPAFVASLPGGRVYGENSWVITPDNYLLWDVSYEWSNDPMRHPIFQCKSLPKPQSLPGTAAVINKIGSFNYYHWMYDCLPRIYLIRRSRKNVSKYIVGPNLQPFQFETLAALGIHKNEIVPCDPNLHLEAEELLVPSLPRGEQWAHSFLKHHFKQFHPYIPATKRLYISRSRALGRTLANEDQVLKVLNAYGFETVHTQDLSVLDQVQLFSSAEIVISPTGSALTNLTFAKPGTKVLEFFSTDFQPSEIKQICIYGELPYWNLIGEGVRPSKFAKSKGYWSGLDNIQVDIEQLKLVLKSMGL